MTDSTLSMLPVDAERALLVGRAWRAGAGPSVLALRHGIVVDISAHAATMAELLERLDAADIARNAPGDAIGTLAELLANARTEGTRLLAPNDLQAIKACGVTFAVSLLERVIEEQAKGDPARAGELRGAMQECIGDDLSAIQPGSPAAGKLKQDLIARGLWSPYMEVGIGPDGNRSRSEQSGRGARRQPGQRRQPARHRRRQRLAAR